MGIELTRSMLLAATPFIAIQIGLAIYCLIKLKHDEVANLNKPLWAAIILLSNLVGPILYLTVGRKKDR